MNLEVDPPKKRKKTSPSSPSFLSLPDVIVINVLARVSRSYYPRLSLVCKTFHDILKSKELYAARFQLKVQESLYYVGLKFPNTDHPLWYSLWIKPDLSPSLVREPSGYFHHLPLYVLRVGSECYALKQSHPPSPYMLVHNDEDCFWSETPRMKVARESAVAAVLDGKIYVMGGCSASESKNWAEVFDPKTQTWESLPDPGAKIRFALIKKIEVSDGKINLRVSSKSLRDDCVYVYIPKEGKWDVVLGVPEWCVISIDNVDYSCVEHTCYWFDANRNEWREVRGLGRGVIDCNYHHRIIDIANYGGKLLIIWYKFTQAVEIWCAVTALETRDGDVWANVECAGSLLTVPNSSMFCRSLKIRA